MATSRRRKTSEPPPLDISLAALAQFAGAPLDEDQAGPALEQAIEAASAFTGQPIPDSCLHPIRQGIFLYAMALLVAPAAEPPSLVRAMWSQHVSASEG